MAGRRGQWGGRGSAGHGPRRGLRSNVPAAESARVGAPADTIAVPAVAVPVTRTVYVLENGRPVPREVEIGIADGSNTEIKGGLKEGELVITGLGQGKSSNGSSTQRSRIPMMGGFGGPPH